jgi:taurine dioxygenase
VSRPDFRVDTLWASLRAAYEALSPALQALCSTLTGWHGVDASLRRTVVDRHGAELASRFEEAHPRVRHPLVRAHPDTDAPCLFVCPMYLERIPELYADESDVLLSHLRDVAVDPNRSLRWHWSEGDVAIWDESCTLHRALGDHHPSGAEDASMHHRRRAAPLGHRREHRRRRLHYPPSRLGLKRPSPGRTRPDS